MSALRRIGAVTDESAAAAERHLDDVHAYLVYLTGDRASAEELTAETFARACERWRRFDPRRGSVRTWLCQLARSTALDHFRAEARRRRREGRFAAREPRAAGGFGGGRFPWLEAPAARVSAGVRAVAAVRPAPRLGAHLALPARALDRARPLPRRGSPPPARGSLRSPRAACCRGLRRGTFP